MSAEEEGLAAPETTPICIVCLEPVPELACFCPSCRSPIDPLAMMVPYYSYYAQGSMARRAIAEPRSRFGYYTTFSILIFIIIGALTRIIPSLFQLSVEVDYSLFMLCLGAIEFVAAISGIILLRQNRKKFTTPIEND